MTLRNQMLTLSLATLLVPWFGWMLVQELEEFLRDNQARGLAGAARTLSESLPESARVELFGRGNSLPLRALETRPVIDGYADDWPEAGSALSYEASADSPLSLERSAGSPRLELLGARWSNQDFLFLRVADATPRRSQPPGAGNDNGAVDAVILVLRGGRGITRFRIQTAAPGPLLVSSQTEGGGQLEGYWRESDDGYRLELALPPSGRAINLSVGVEDAWRDRASVVRVSEAGTLRDGVPASWLSPSGEDVAL
ncbi:MAG: hypothetical protein AAGH19_11430, partial [Pseudomonadota bacterium]